MAYKEGARPITLGALVAGDNVIVPANMLGVSSTGQPFGSIHVWQTEFVSASSTVIQPKSNQTPISGAYNLTAPGTSVVQQNTGQEWQKCLPGQALIWNSSAATTLTGTIWVTYA